MLFMNISYLYVIGAENEAPIKIGFSKNPEKRLKALQTGYPKALYLHTKQEFETNKIRVIEKMIHKELSHLRSKGEWFDMTPEDAVLHVEHMRIMYEDTSINVLKSLTD